MSDEKAILRTLFDRYYKKDQTPQELVSSYWQDMYKKAKAEELDDDIRLVMAQGFGDLQLKDFAHKIFSCVNIFVLFLFLLNKKEIFSFYKKGKALCRRMQVAFTINCFYQVCNAALICRHLPEKKSFNIINIGDGYGFLSSLLLDVYPEAKVFFVDLGKTMLFQAQYCLKAHGDKKAVLLLDEEGLGKAEQCQIIFCPAENLHLLGQQSFDLAINVNSMQEMNYKTIERYFSFLRQHLREENLFYCCNRVEKKLRGGELVKYAEFPWSKEDKHFVDELCPWHKFFIDCKKVSDKGLTVFNVRIPFVNYMDGEVWHRLTCLKT